MSKGTRTGPAARKRKGDTRPRAEIAATPQRRVRVNLGRHLQYEDAQDHADRLIRDARIDGAPMPDLQIRLRADGYHLYRRDEIGH